MRDLLADLRNLHDSKRISESRTDHPVRRSRTTSTARTLSRDNVRVTPITVYSGTG